MPARPVTRASTGPLPTPEAPHPAERDVSTRIPARVQIMGWVMLLMAVVLVASP